MSPVTRPVTHRRCVSAPPMVAFEMTTLRSTLPRVSRQKHHGHHRTTSMIHIPTSSQIHLPLIRSENDKTSPEPLPSLSDLDLSPHASPTLPLSRSPSPSPSLKMEKRMVKVDPSVAAYLKKGGVIYVRSKEGRRVKLHLPRIALM